MTGLRWFWVMRGHVREAGAWLERLLAAPVAATPTVERATALAWSALVRSVLAESGGPDLARARLEASLDMFRAIGDPQALPRALRALGQSASWFRDTGAARVWFTEGLARCRQADDLNGQGWALRGLAELARDQGDQESAIHLYRESQAAYRRAGNRDRAAGAQAALGQALRAAGDLAGARRCHEAALAVWRELGYLTGVAGALNGLGEVAYGEGDAATARALYEESLAGYREVGARHFAAAVLRNLALLGATTGDAGGGVARAHLEEALGIWRDLGQEEQSASALEAFAALAAAGGQPVRALRRAGAADALWAASGRPRPPKLQARFDAQLAPARQSLGERAGGVYAAGRSLDGEQVLDQAVAVAVAPLAPHGVAVVTPPPPRAVAPSVTGPLAVPVGPLRLDAQTYTVWRGGQPLPRPLAAREFALVRYLYVRAGRVCSRRELGDAVWGRDRWDPAMLYQLVRRVKGKLEPDPERPRYLHNVPGFGYRLTP